jgi:hypothetical protein
MPPLPPLADTVKLETTWTGPNGTKAANIMYALMGTGWVVSVPNLTTLANNLITAWNHTGTACLGAFVCPPWGSAQVIATDNGGTTEDSVSVPWTNTNGGNTNPLPPNCAAVISWAIPAHYRGGHPRTYLPGPTNAALQVANGNQWTSSFRSSLAAAAQNFLTSFAAGIVAGAVEQLGTVSHFRNNAPLATPVFYPYTGGTIHGRVDSQRRRLGKESLYL